MGSCLPQDHKYRKFISLLHPNGPIEKIGIALFGAGAAGTVHLTNLLSNQRVQLLYVVEEIDERAKTVKEGLGLGSVNFVNFSSIDAVLEDIRVQGVMIATPTKTHYDIVTRSLEKGKAVFCEKPLGGNIEEVKQSYALAFKQDVPLFCAFQRRFDPSIRSIYESVQNGELGKVHLIKSCSRDSPMPSINYLKSSNGFIQDSAVHDIDTVCWIVGQLPSQVFVTGVANRKEIADIPDYDTLVIQLIFPSGTVGLIDLSRSAIYGYDQRIEVFGPEGMLQCDNQPSLSVKSRKSDSSQVAPIWYNFVSRYEDAYKNELDHFLDVIQGKASPLVKPEETIAVAQICTAAVKSAKTGIPIDINYHF